MSYLSNDILISLLEKYGIRKIVISSGSRNIPFVSAVEVDSYFECFSVIDERNAAFFALGVSQQCNEPVVIVCTSGTAASNYLSGITEAFYSNAPVVAVTFDRSPYTLNQLETQKIDQPSIFKEVCREVVSLPIIKDDDDIWYCQRLINEALIAATKKTSGPVNINIPLTGGQNELVDASLNHKKVTETRKIDYIALDDDEKWKLMADKLLEAKNVLFVMGQASNVSQKDKESMDSFFAVSGYPLLSDNLSNYRCKQTVFAESTIKALNSRTIRNLMPDIVITYGCNFQERIKDVFKGNKGAFEHWSIEPTGKVKDVFKSQTVLFDCSYGFFFKKMFSLMVGNVLYDDSYLNKWKKIEDAAKLPEMDFTNFFAIGELAENIPDDSILHLSILNSTRLMQFYKLKTSVKCYSNVNAFGIDGCLPTFMGQAYSTDKLAFLVIGDLSFFYSMNAIAIKNRKNNIRIMVINNGGGAEFHIMPDSNSLPNIDCHIGAAHDRKVKGWAESMGYEYLSADSKETFNQALRLFINDSHSKPVIFEVFTNMKEDGEHLLSVYRYLENEVSSLL